MLYVSGTFCPEVERKCLSSEENGANHITICHAFEHETKCVAPEEERAFCMDEYEFPNRKGAHPSWMVTWYDAQATCESKGKRLCYESEWTMACEGPDKTPFPYGWERDQTACNVDNYYIAPRIDVMFNLGDAGDDSGDASARELERVDQSVPSGAMERCVSGFGVHDMPGNFDEWVTDDQPIGPRGADTGMWSALKGGAWGHVRNACRPLTTSHSPGFSYYFVSFRCCADPTSDGDGGSAPTAYVPPSNAYAAPKVAAQDKAPRVFPRDGGAPGPSRTKVPPP
jgi:formylglycine-generating enzyme required for sulfatase activity